MPKRLEPAPSGDLSAKAFERLMDPANKAAMTELVEYANERYLYWDDFKYRPMPSGIDPADAWRFLKLMRSTSRIDTPVRTADGMAFTYLPTSEIQRCLHLIDQQAGGPVNPADLSTSADARSRYRVSSLMEESIASSQIEGASTTRRVAKEMLRTGRAPRDVSERMIANNYRALMMMADLAEEPLTPELITHIQAVLTEDTLDCESDAGRIRESDDIIVHDELNRILHVPPPATTLDAELKRLCAFANGEGGDFVHPVVKGTILHFWLAYLHPFADGNGRTARALFTLQMLKSGYWLFEYLSVSRVLMGKRSGYDRAYLYAEIDDCDFTYFLNFHAHVVNSAFDGLWQYLDRKNSEDRNLIGLLKLAPDLNYRQRTVLGEALEDVGAVFTVEAHRASNGVAYATARADLLDLVDRGYLEQRREGRAFMFTPVEGLRDRLQRKGGKRRR